MTRPTARAARTTDHGQVSLLIVGFAVVLVMLVGVVVDASAAYLRRQSLDSLADGAALSAADGVQGTRVYTHGLGRVAWVDPDVAERYVALYLRRTGALQRYPGLTWDVRANGAGVTVWLAAPQRLPIRPPGWGDTAVVRATASAIVPVG